MLEFATLLCSADARIVAKMSYGAPFLYKYGPLGYFSVDKKQGLYFAFYWGKLLVPFDESGIFHPDDRKMVKLVFFEGKLADESFLGAFLILLDEALRIDDLRYGKNR